jgi:hypothetical protein
MSDSHLSPWFAETNSNPIPIKILLFVCRVSTLFRFDRAKNLYSLAAHFRERMHVRGIEITQGQYEFGVLCIESGVVLARCESMSFRTGI